ncbi:MAG: hypothetical protein ACRDTJ_16365 [Pseudonocardiaceae bacterium]
MTTTTEAHIAVWKDARDEAARRMGIYFGTNPSAWAAAMRDHGTATRELRQMEESA